MTFSIIARDEITGFYGIAVASRFFAVGSVIPHFGRNCAVASQALVNPMWGIAGVQHLSSGMSAADALNTTKLLDNGQSQRQVHMIDQAGKTAAHTGTDCIGWAGHLNEDGVSVAGNMLENEQVIMAMLQYYNDHKKTDFASRMLGAMQAGENAGGDKRGRQSASLTIHRGELFPWLDLRSDDHDAPLDEIERLLAVAQERFIYFTELMGHSNHFSGKADRTEIDAAIKKGNEERHKNGIKSASRATTKTLLNKG